MIRIPEGEIDLLAVGETLVDMISEEETDDLAHASTFHRYLGGSPTNIAVYVSKLGMRAAVVSKVGDDPLGRFAAEELRKAGVLPDYLAVDPESHTTVSFITRSRGTPDFMILRGADGRLTSDEVPEDAVARARVVHASTFALSMEPCRSAVEKAFRLARDGGKIVSLDPNYSARVWPDRREALGVLRRLMSYATLTKPSLDDARRLFGPGRTEREYIELFHEMGPSVVVLTMGGRGTLLSTPQGITEIPSRPTRVMDVTGAGDSFWAGFIVALLDGHSLGDAALFAREVAEMKLSSVGPPPASIDRRALYARLARRGTMPETGLSH